MFRNRFLISLFAFGAAIAVAAHSPRAGTSSHVAAVCARTFKAAYQLVSDPTETFYRKHAVGPLLADTVSPPDLDALAAVGPPSHLARTRLPGAEIEVLGATLKFPELDLHLRTIYESPEDFIGRTLGFRPGKQIGSGGYKREFEHPTNPKLVIKLLDPVGIRSANKKVAPFDLSLTDLNSSLNSGALMYQRELAIFDWLPGVLERLSKEAPPWAPKLRVAKIFNREERKQIMAGVIIMERVSLGSVLAALKVPPNPWAYASESSPRFEIFRYWLDLLDAHLVPVMVRRFDTAWGFENRFRWFTDDPSNITTGIDYGGFIYRNISAEEDSVLILFDG